MKILIFLLTKKIPASIMILARGLEREFNNEFYTTWINEEKYSRGRRGAPAKGVGRSRGARVQIPPSPL